MESLAICCDEDEQAEYLEYAAKLLECAIARLEDHDNDDIMPDAVTKIMMQK
ncbi:hypothetical protein M378DRAFT_162250 [Amanita muscaria Koide BX008]|uniref:Uncharacterized protein n=1 Tax=Amanita muscaria (strain Koide BX008) TaxID=946122 RepID=A0A0C2SPX6_AMAMK|nr:hypothetical protein M378DRAFT_162250 [Amanita muscaria Koide BX008]